MTAGRCLCGAVRYEIDGPFGFMVNCHCSICRKAHGSQFVTFVAAPLAGFRWVSGEDHLTAYASSPKGQRTFCRTCGSAGPMLASDMGMVIAAAGSLEGDPGIRPQMHIFTGSKAPGYEITDSLPQHEEYPPEWGGEGLPREVAKARDGVTTGGCLCGAVAWEADGPPARMMNCHCSRCRLARGAAHATNAFYRLEQFRWVRGEDHVDSYKVPDAKFFAQAFCRTCGSPAPRLLDPFNRAMVAVGTADTDPGLQPSAHIFVASKAPWFEITDAIPQYEEMPPR